ncbi:hypothetical protein EDB84DRAFT_1437322 [Lactarius hengduanensis]|nr:hypothetical protein EDB84DRAFT_1437322 [Lactarius hengduanensis]
MPRILNDPNQTVCPDFDGPKWEFLRRCIINAHPGANPLTAEEAACQLRGAWTKDNDARIAAWNAQLEQDRAEQDKRDRQAGELNEVRRVQLEKEAEEQRREAEKKKPRLNPFDPTRRVSDWIVPRPASYALDKINNLEYVELDYFTDRRPSKNIRNDEDLSWEEMLEAKNTMLHFMTQSGLWPTAHSESLKAFFVALEQHPRKFRVNGKKVLLVYQSRVRREWFDALACNEGFNIGLIGDDLVQNIANEVSDKIWEREMDKIRRITQAAVEISSTRPPSKLHHEWDHEARERTRSPSLSRVEPSRKRLRSRSPVMSCNTELSRP